ncbi:23S rRNA (pseudouridine(1915)-N(3))-methyltransferase RlmH [Rhodomicrobium sp. Az07]|uniref:23S rRNA (pseudouridine(1915)-N(3))-methyltransferase RlmH n=1 Tax=Rhodomicrobium sp. Az07 TaxID=2839034 RepID=UPI001BEBB3E8|nr:23S rRNA (pseudouridine(1915)-N(3))-methyltransferase RlmH [Rhodomicrobium sp. Az07]MBT3071650.1 23S rRNA (pseudouridine(1915)-N(3))-methyltransferase RlmH [Rhodomicrobium sp. Az07]
MKISILAVGRLKNGAEQTQFNRYFDLFNASARNLAMGPMAVFETGEGRSESVAERKEAEAHELLKRIGGARLVALDESGQSLTSYEFTAMVSRLRDEALDVAFAIGGPDGHGETLKSAAHFKLSLGKMTLPHGLVRIVLAEQLYRAMTILQGHPYHRA